MVGESPKSTHGDSGVMGENEGKMGKPLVKISQKLTDSMPGCIRALYKAKRAYIRY
jgi:hypothetical protein